MTMGGEYLQKGRVSIPSGRLTSAASVSEERVRTLDDSIGLQRSTHTSSIYELSYELHTYTVRII